jgi:hypothetical protein
MVTDTESVKIPGKRVPLLCNADCVGNTAYPPAKSPVLLQKRSIQHPQQSDPKSRQYSGSNYLSLLTDSPEYQAEGDKAVRFLADEANGPR